jgi:hypothetical protein
MNQTPNKSPLFTDRLRFVSRGTIPLRDADFDYQDLIVEWRMLDAE